MKYWGRGVSFGFGLDWKYDIHDLEIPVLVIH